MVKNTSTISTFTTPIANGSSDTCDLVNTPRDIQYDVKINLVLASGTVSGSVVVELISVDSSGNEYPPADSEDNRTITILSDQLEADGATNNYFAKGIDRVAGLNNLKFKITNDSGVAIDTAEIILGKLQF